MSAIVSPMIEKLTRLADVVPLEAPLALAISIGNICDFRCKYCTSAVEDTRTKDRLKPHMMTLSEFEPLLSHLQEFERPIKQITFVSQGETILNRNLPDMIRQIKYKHVAEKVKVITNANALTEEYSDDLLEAGLDKIKISLQGLSQERYREVCNPPSGFSFERLKKQIEYFYRHRGSCKVYIKMIDIALQEGEEKAFYEMFGSMADYIFIEKCSASDNNVHRYGWDIDSGICSSAFYYMMIDVWGNVYPCCVSAPFQGTQYAIGNIYQKTLKNMWNEEFRQLQLQLINHSLPSDHICYNCKFFHAIEKPEDVLNDPTGVILKRYEALDIPPRKL